MTFFTAILIYRSFRESSKSNLKLAHATIHGVALFCTISGLKVAYSHHNDENPHIYTLHAWMGIGAVGVFALQYLIGFFCFLFPKAGASVRSKVLPVHVFIGIFGFVLAIAACLLGIAQKGTGNYLAYGIAIGIVIYGVFVSHLVTKPEYKRQPLLEEMLLIHQGQVQTRKWEASAWQGFAFWILAFLKEFSIKIQTDAYL